MYKLVANVRPGGDEDSSREQQLLRGCVGAHIWCGDSLAAVFNGGLALTIIATVDNSPNEQIRQAYLHGLVLAMSHCAITGSIPTVVDTAKDR